jgi:hypothetical protein
VEIYDHTVQRLVRELVANKIGLENRGATEVPPFCATSAAEFKHWKHAAELEEAMAPAP